MYKLQGGTLIYVDKFSMGFFQENQIKEASTNFNSVKTKWLFFKQGRMLDCTFFVAFT